MATQYNIHEAKTQFSKLVDRALSGEEIIVAKAGKPAVRLVPVTAERAVLRTPGALKGLVPPSPDEAFFEPMPDAELRLWGMI